MGALTGSARMSFVSIVQMRVPSLSRVQRCHGVEIKKEWLKFLVTKRKTYGRSRLRALVGSVSMIQYLNRIYISNPF